mmetsp:Transcript_51418/g.129016  ORF Transcript_51418/g.129016 Transcript_51418/m.129016 type:complete len:235 (-) Transcript_51418:115-819(-)
MSMCVCVSIEVHSPPRIIALSSPFQESSASWITSGSVISSRRIQRFCSVPWFCGSTLGSVVVEMASDADTSQGRTRSTRRLSSSVFTSKTRYRLSFPITGWSSFSSSSSTRKRIVVLALQSATLLSGRAPSGMSSSSSSSSSLIGEDSCSFSSSTSTSTSSSSWSTFDAWRRNRSPARDSPRVRLLLCCFASLRRFRFSILLACGDETRETTDGRSHSPFSSVFSSVSSKRNAM